MKDIDDNDDDDDVHYEVYEKNINTGNLFSIKNNSRKRNQNITPKTTTAKIVDTAFKYKQLV